VQQRPPVNGRAFTTQQRGPAYARQRATAQQHATTRAIAAQPRAVAHASANVPRAHAQQARATEGHGRAVHQSNARRGNDRDHDRDHH
jgi:hypothetical protein